jgi:hypothetical protein
MTELTNSALARLQAGELSLGIGIRITNSPAIARTMAVGGFDWLFIDLEHGNLGIESCAHVSVAGLDAGIARLVRVPPGPSAVTEFVSSPDRATSDAVIATHAAFADKSVRQQSAMRSSMTCIFLNRIANS